MIRKHEDFAASFAPVASLDAKVLILGSIPGRESLKAGRYYAHPRNQFWPIMASLFGFAADAPYEERLLALQGSGVALWDVMHSCHRAGSLDASIEADTVEPNDFAAFFVAHPYIRTVFYNGATAYAAYHRHVLPTLQALPLPVSLRHTRLPSTSPAHASLSLAQKRVAWQVVAQEASA